MNDTDIVEPQEGGETVASVEAQTQEEKTFSQADLEKIIQDRLNRQRAQLERKYEGVDVDKYRQLEQEEENRRIEELKKREQFDQVLKETVEKKDGQISSLRNEIHAIKVEGALLNQASASRAINPNQVVQLLRNSVRLGDSGHAEVLDDNGGVRYNENGEPMEVSELVNEFLTANPHFVNANSSGSGSKSNMNHNTGPKDLQLSDLDMKNPEHRKIYSQMMDPRRVRKFVAQ